jgi:hypothetical protein
MAHLVSIPAPADYWRPQLSKLSLFDKNGTAALSVWGLSEPYHDDMWCVGAEGTERVASNLYKSKNPDLISFNLRGIRDGDKLRVYRNLGYPSRYEWVKHSEAVTVAYVQGDKWATLRAQDKLPKCKHNANISYYPHGIAQRRPPLSEEQWLQSVINVFDKICSNALGNQIVKMVSRKIFISPWIHNTTNAMSDILFTPADFAGKFAPGQQVDEVLLHEIVHVVEGSNSGYSDTVPGFKFSGSDFLSVNATNVYSVLLGRALRKDHNGFAFLDNSYFTDPKKHFQDFSANYAVAKAHNPALYNVLKNSSNLWNPFKF